MERDLVKEFEEAQNNGTVHQFINSLSTNELRALTLLELSRLDETIAEIQQKFFPSERKPHDDACL